MKNLMLMLAFPLLLAGLMVLINESSSAPHHRYDPGRCTRYCHDHECQHVAADSEVAALLADAYQQHILWLRHNPLGLSYQAMNLLVYLLLIPVLFLGLLWGIIRPKNRGK